MEAPQPGAAARDTGLPPGVAVGDLGRRFLAYLIDSAIPGLAVGVIAGVLPGSNGGGAVVLSVVALVVTVAWALLCWWRLSQRAATPGMAVMKLQLVGFLDGRPVGWGRVLVRWLVFTLLGVTGIGLIVLLASLVVHPRRQGWHDRAANAVVIVERTLAPPRPRPASGQSEQHDAGAAVAPERSAVLANGSGPVARTGATAIAAQAEAHPVGVDGAQRHGPEPERAEPERAEPEGVGIGQVEAVAAPGRSILQGWVVELDDGREIDVDGLVLVGRNPQPRLGEEDAHLVRVADQSRTVSKTHLALGVDDAGLFVVDRGSTNGSTVTSADRASRACAPHTAISVAEGAVVSIGNHWLRIRREPE